MGPPDILGVASALALLTVVSGCWRLMRTVRSRSSRLLFASVVTLVLWALLSDTIYRAVFYHSDLSHPAGWENWFYLSLETFVPALLILLASVAFWFVVRSLPRADKASGTE
jgi:Kef-type K+ transport system membrane component KefB